jgi:hypothetical protein
MFYGNATKHCAGDSFCEIMAKDIYTELSVRMLKVVRPIDKSIAPLVFVGETDTNSYFLNGYRYNVTTHSSSQIFGAVASSYYLYDNKLYWLYSGYEWFDVSATDTSKSIYIHTAQVQDAVDPSAAIRYSESPWNGVDSSDHGFTLQLNATQFCNRPNLFFDISDSASLFFLYDCGYRPSSRNSNLIPNGLYKVKIDDADKMLKPLGDHSASLFFTQLISARKFCF